MRTRMQQPEQERRPVETTPDPVVVQAKLVVGRADDPLELEADRVAAEVARRLVEPVPVSEAPEDGVSRMVVRRSAAPAGEGVIGLEGGEVDAGTEAAIRNPGPGSRLPEGVRRVVEPVLGADLGGVRVHTDRAADAAAAGMQARAFTTGSHVFFRAGEYRPDTGPGRELLAHELTHVVQQSGAAGAGAARQIQRMPSPAAVQKRTGKTAKKGKKIFGRNVGGTESYNALLDYLRAYNDYIMKNTVAEKATEAMKQVAAISRHIDDIVAAANQYKAKGKDADPAVVAVCDELIRMAPLEKKILPDIAARWTQNPGFGGVGNPKWFLQIPADPAKFTSKNADMRPTAVTAAGASDKGQTKSVDKVTDARGRTGYFAEDQGEDDRHGDVAQGILHDYGVKSGEYALHNRSIAMSRLDKLLGAGVIARTERGIKGDKVGTFMEEAKGDPASKVWDKITDLDQQPKLAALLSRLHLVDLIAGQVDRHANNYFIQRDGNGKVIGVTGIDLDLSWGAGGKTFSTNIEQGSHGSRNDKGKQKTWAMNWLPGMARYVDAELAERIIALDPEDLRAILIDLLQPNEIDAAVKRLVDLQAALVELKKQGHLLKPDEWTQQIQADLIKESKATMEFNMMGAFAGGGRGYFGRDAAIEQDKRGSSK